MDKYQALLGSNNASSDFSANLQVESNNKQLTSEGKPVTSSAGALGAAQIMETTAPEAAEAAGVEYNKYKLKYVKDYNVKLGEAYYNKQKDKFGSTELADAAYNAGPGATQKAIDKAKKEGGSWKDYLPAETQKYIQSTSSKRGSQEPQQEPTTTNKYSQFLSSKQEPTPTNKYQTLLSGKQTQDPYRDISGLETAAEHAIFGIPVSAGAYAGWKSGIALGTEAGEYLAPATEGTSIIAGPIIGGLIGMFTGGYATDKLLRAAGPQELNRLLDEGSKQHPYAALSGDIASNFPVFGIGLPKTITTAAGKTISAEKQATLLITGGAAIEAGREKAVGEPLDPTKIAISALTMPLFSGEPTEFGKAVTFEKLRTTESKEMLSDLQKKINGTAYEDIINQRLEEERNLQSFAQFKEENLRNAYNRFKGTLNEGATIPSFEDWKSRPGSESFQDKELNERYEEHTRQKALAYIDANHPELVRPNVNSAKLPKDTVSMRDFFYNFVGAKTQDGIIGGHIMKLAERDGIDATMRENIRKHAETGFKLNKVEQGHYDKYFNESLKTLKSNIRYLMDKGLIPKEKMDDNFFPRQLSPMDKATRDRLQEKGLLDEDASWWEEWKDKLIGRDFGAQDISRVQSAGKDRSIFRLDKITGGSIIHINKNGRVVEWILQEGKVIAQDASILTKDGRVKVGDKLLGGTIREASIEHIEQHSPYKYNKDSLAVLLNKLNESREMVRAHQMISELKNTTYFKQNAHEIKPGINIPEGFVIPKNLDKLPEFQGYAFRPRTAAILEDFANSTQATLLTNASGLLVKNMMLNPLPHIFNEAWHLYNARGLSGWVTPAGLKRFAEGMPKALRSVIEQDKDYRRILEQNGSLLAPSTRENLLENSIHQRALNEFAEGGGLKELARFFGRSVVDMYDGISKASSKAMWILRDTMYLQYVRELMEHKGLTEEMAIKEAERHLPNYRLPETIGDKVIGERAGRLLSKTLQNPNISVFSRYHYGMTKSILETMKDLGAIRKGAEGMEEFKQGVDTMAAVLVAAAALYPLMDMVAQSLTGNPDAKQRRAGPYHLGHAISEVADGTKDPQAVLSAIFTFNPALLGLVQLGLDRNLYNGQHIYNPESAPDVIARDVGKYVFGQLPQAGQVMRASAEPGGEGFNTMAARQADIESPSHVKALKQKMMINKLKLQAKLYDMKRRAGLK